MASNKDPKSSKTAHVMNLLSKNRNAEPAPAPQAEPAESAVPAAPAPAAPPIPPIISSINADAAVSSQIRDALEAALDPAEAPLAEPRQPAAPPSVPPASPSPAPVPPQPVEEPAPQPPEPAAGEESAPHQKAYEPPTYVNVMEVLVREKAERYMRATGMCCCDQCMVDVMAYTLSHLPPKYVVMSEGERIPKLTFYEVQSSSDITTQLMRACEIVSRAPHHGRE